MELKDDPDVAAVLKIVQVAKTSIQLANAKSKAHQMQATLASLSKQSPEYEAALPSHARPLQAQAFCSHCATKRQVGSTEVYCGGCGAKHEFAIPAAAAAAAAAVSLLPKALPSVQVAALHAA